MGLVVRNVRLDGFFKGTFPQVPPPPSGIVTDGLMINLDAGNSSSYSGSGTNWLDLSGNNNNATLINSPTYSSANSGYFTFNGSNNYAPTSNDVTIGVGESRTIEVVFQKLGSGGPLFYQHRTTNSHGFSGVQATTNFTFETTTSYSLPYTYFLTHSTTLQNNVWYHAIISVVIPARISASMLPMTGTLGLNGNFETKTTNINTDAPPVSYPMEVARWRNYIWGTGYGNARIAIARLYNRALSQAEMEQNFNALRGRYGL